MDPSLQQKFEKGGYSGIYNEQPSLAIRLMSDFLDCYRTKNQQELAARDSDWWEDKHHFCECLEEIRDALHPEAILTVGQQKMLAGHLHYCADNYESCWETVDRMGIVNFVHSCAALNR
jgi:hypothetical protein